MGIFNDMYDETPTPMADGAQSWLSIQRWLRETRTKLTDRFLTDFKAVWEDSMETKETIDHQLMKGVRGEVPDYANKPYKLKASSQGTVANVYVFVDEAGNMTHQSDRNHWFIPAQYVAAYIAGLNALVNTPDPTVIDVNYEQVGLNLPQTNSQMSAQQNELTLKYLQSKQRR